MKRRLKVATLILLACASGTAFAQNTGTPPHFNTSLKWFGTVHANLYLDPTCSEVLQPNERCVVLQPAPDTTEWNELEISKVTLPGRVLKNVLCPVFTQTLSYRHGNTTGAAEIARLVHQYSLVLESEALQGVHPDTGLPLNGKYEGAWGGRRTERTLPAGEYQQESELFTRDCRDGSDRASFPLGGAVWDEMVKKPLTIHLTLRGNARLLQGATLSIHMRVMGN